MKLTQEQMQEIRETVEMSFETGHLCFDNKEDFKRDFEGIQPERPLMMRGSIIVN